MTRRMHPAAARLARHLAVAATIALPALAGAQEGAKGDDLALAPLPIAQVQPHYPLALADRRVEGEVVASFVVDETGRADMKSFTVVSASHPFFADAVRDAVSRSLYAPGVAQGARVPAPVEQKFVFHLRGRAVAAAAASVQTALR